MIDDHIRFDAVIEATRFIPNEANSARAIYTISGAAAKFCGAITHSPKVAEGQFEDYCLVHLN